MAELVEAKGLLERVFCPDVKTNEGYEAVEVQKDRDDFNNGLLIDNGIHIGFNHMNGR